MTTASTEISHESARQATFADRTDNNAADAPRNKVNADAVKNAKIMIVDDEAFNIAVTKRYLENFGYEQFVTTTESHLALDLIRSERPDAVLLDIMMPQVSGLDILHEMSADDSLRHIPVIILTATTDSETKREALSMGATDFLSKPVDSNDLVPRVRNALVVKAHQDHLANYAVELERQVNIRTAELASSRAEVIHCLARAAEYRDDDTGHHVLRVGKYVGIIARQLGFTESQAEMTELAAQLHDIGKIGIPDEILLCPGKLDPEQYAFMQKHCAIGKQIIKPMAEHDWRKLRTHTELGSGIVGVSSSPLLMTASRIAQSHHEKWDGSGYPLGLAGEDIPIEGRITAVADVFDALSSPRPYKPPFPRDKCFQILRDERGKHFDPQVIDAFFAKSDVIVQVQLDYMDLP